MAAELQFSFASSKTCYFLVRNRVAQIWSTVGSAFETYTTANYADYTINAAEQGAASAFYAGTMPGAIPAGVYSIVAKQQLGGAPAESDPVVAGGDYQWNGLVTLPLSDLATSGQVGQIGPLRLARGVMVTNFPVYLVSSADHVTPFTSGVLSGQVARDNGSFTALQSGAFAETGLGFYNLQALTSGDLLANTAKLVFTAAGISGGSADPRPMSIILQRVSGQA